MWKKIERKDIKFYILISIIILTFCLILSYQYSLENKVIENEKSIIIYTVALIITIIATISVCSIIYFKKNITEKKVFLYSIPIICLLFLIAMPMFKAHDEGEHFKKAYEVSIGGILYSKSPTIILPYNVIENNGQKWWQLDISYNKLVELFSTKLEESNLVKSRRVCTSYPSIQYAPQAIGIAVAKIFTDRILVMAYLGRILNCIVSLFICYKSLKIMPFAKKSILSLLYIPILIEGLISLSGDAILISVSYLFLAYVLKFIFKDSKAKLKYEEKMILFILAVILSMCKMVYLPLVFMVLLIPTEKFKNKKMSYMYKIGVITICILVTMSIFVFSMNLGEKSREGSDSGIQLEKVLTSPINYISTLLSSMNENGSYYLESLFGSELSWSEDIKLHFIVPYGLCALTIMSAILDNDIKSILSKKQKYFILCIILLSIVLIFSSMYIAWTTIDSNLIEGVQGRYFLPLMPLILILIGSIPIKSYIKEENMLKFIGITGTLMQVYVIMSIVIKKL